ncbi:hypothetical protein ACWEVP_49410 [Amycolatopsis sp. NPDC003865]
MPDDEEWAFENEIDLWDDDEGQPQVEAEREPDGPTGRDADAVVTVTVSPDGEIQQVRLAGDWKSKVDPRGLHANVLAAANAATIEALGRRAREVRENPPQRPRGNADETPLNARDVLRLSDAVRAEVDGVSARLALIDRPVDATSSGGHVTGTAQSGRFVSLDVDSTWASAARNAEIEAELTEVLKSLHHSSVPDGTTRQVGKATAELLSLIHDPDRLIRRVRLASSQPGTTGRAEG